MNRYIGTGRLVRDPELLALADGTPMCKLRIAVEGMARGEVGFINVTTFGPGGGAAGKMLTTGWLVGIDGRLQYSNWETDDGEKRCDWEVVGRVEFLAAPRGAVESMDSSEPSDAGPREEAAAA